MISAADTTCDWQIHTGDVAVWGVGAHEQHGPHLPLNTDALCADYFAKFIAEGLNAALLPTLPFATSLEHAGFRGSLSLRPETAMQVVRDMADELERQHFRVLVIVNFHGGNFFLTPVCRDINRMDRQLKILLVAPYEFADMSGLESAPGTDIHAGEFETSFMMELFPEVVREPLPTEGRVASSSILQQRDLTLLGVGHFSPSGPVGFPACASREKGRSLVASMKEGTLAYVRDRLARLRDQPRFCGKGALAIRPMEACDIADGMRLRTLAGWNQLEADWQMYLEAAPKGCFCMVHNGLPVGTATTIDYEGRSSWIGMVLVDPAFRRMGIASRLMTQAMTHLETCSCVKLDATPDGEKVYAKLGFEPEYRLQRMTVTALPADVVSRGESVAGLAEDEEVRLLEEADMAQVFALDEPVFGANRSVVLQALRRAAPQVAYGLWREGALVAYVLGRPGANFFQLGPMVADACDDARTVATAAMQTLVGRPVVMDVPEAQEALRAWLFACGFADQRPFLRMFYGQNDAPGEPNRVWAIAGPELG